MTFGLLNQFRLSIGGRAKLHSKCGIRNELAKKVTEKYLPNALPVLSGCEGNDAETIEAIKTIEERQEFHKVSAIFAIEKSRCKHGFPRAYVQLPVYHPSDDCDGNNTDKTTTSKQSSKSIHEDYIAQSCMIRLSCPHLTKAIDRFEYKENGIVRINAGLNETDNQDNFQPLAPPHHPPAQPVVEENLVPTAVAMRDHFRSINAHWKELKGELVSPEQYDILQARLGAIGADHFLNSGLGGISPKKVGDVKCLHTHVADTILRGKSANRFGRWALKKIEEEQGVDPSGCDSCWQQCNRNFQRTDDSYWYVPEKNNHGMRKSKDRKREAQEISRKLAERAILDRKNMKYPNRNIPKNSNNGFWFEGIFIARDKGNELNYNNYRNDLSTSGSNSSTTSSGNSSSTSEWGREWSRQNMLDSTTSSDDLLSERLVGTSPGRSSTIGSRKGLWIDGVYVEKEMLMQQQEEVSESSQEVSSTYSGDNDSSGSDTTAATTGTAADSDSSATNNSNNITQQ